MATSYSCSHWWHAPIYLTLSIFLAAVAISTFQPPSSTTSDTAIAPASVSETITHSTIPTIAAMILRNNGFTIMATLLQFSPQLFLFRPPSATVFALHDTAFSNVSVSPSAVQLLLQYHTLPVSLTFQELLGKSNYSCLPTLVPSKNVSLTKFRVLRSNYSVVMINNVTVSHPNLFLNDFVSIHGVLGPFTSIDHNKSQTKLQDFIINPKHCDNNSSVSDNSSIIIRKNDNRRAVEWVRMIRTLSSTGFVSFAIGLNSVLDQVLNEYPDLSSVTVFAPMDFGFVGSSNWILDRVVRYHVIGRRYSYLQLTALPVKTVLSSLLPGNAVEVSVNANADANVSYGLAVNGVEVVLPEIYSTRMFVIHGISRALDFIDHVDN